MKFRITFRSFHQDKLKETISQMRKVLQPFEETRECQIVAYIALPIRIKKFCVLRSPHVNKDSREHFEIRVSKQFLDIITDTPAVLNSLLKVELPDGVNCSFQFLSAKTLLDQ
jgi:small subunit ribosomal protein S10